MWFCVLTTLVGCMINEKSWLPGFCNTYEKTQRCQLKSLLRVSWVYAAQGFSKIVGWKLTLRWSVCYIATWKVWLIEFMIHQGVWLPWCIKIILVNLSVTKLIRRIILNTQIELAELKARFQNLVSVNFHARSTDGKCTKYERNS